MDFPGWDMNKGFNTHVELMEKNQIVIIAFDYLKIGNFIPEKGGVFTMFFFNYW